MAKISSIIDDLTKVATGVLVLFAILIIGVVMMYKTSGVATDVGLNATQVADVNTVAGNYVTATEDISDTATSIIPFVIVFALIGLVGYVVYTLRGKGSGKGL